MLPADIVLFLVFVALGAAVQSITGFAMALIVMGAVTAFDIADIGFSAAIVSLISLVNTSVALRHTHKFVDLLVWRWLIIGLLPCLLAGVLLLEVLSRGFYEWLRIFLGIVIIMAGMLLMMQPRPFARASGPVATTTIGCASGLIGGLYGAGGAPLAWFMYRQPIDLSVVRATLLATFFVSTLGRTFVVGASGGLTTDVLLIALISVPLVVVVTVLSTRFAHLVPDKQVRRFVFVLLVLLGTFLIVN